MSKVQVKTVHIREFRMTTPCKKIQACNGRVHPIYPRYSIGRIFLYLKQLMLSKITASRKNMFQEIFQGSHYKKAVYKGYALYKRLQLMFGF
ncbi:MAG TPA: hypothetical protein DEO40_07120 [Treponema sp.]|jgi:hypothetical protein|nr:hypothetical protein [Treponema sp.]HCA20431.1 hypothetical protein [Treponema sp.]